MEAQSAAQRKSDLRAQIRATRRALSADERAARDAAVNAWARALSAQVGRGDVVSMYLPTALEPGTEDMLASFADAGARVLTPVVVGPDAPLAWREWRGKSPDLPSEALAEAVLVFVPALAVDCRGARLGQGGGHYDRSLGHAHPQARLIAVVGDGELVDELPHEPHDRLVGWALTPGGVVRLGAEA